MGLTKDDAHLQPGNTRYKDSVFSLLFHDTEKLRELYSALSGTEISRDTAIEITTLNDVLYMAQLNDLSFILGGKLVVLIEHQSTINLNMPLRLLLYAARTYEKIIDRRKLYHKGLEKIPAPEFIVLYNGKEPLPDLTELKLSNAFIDASEYRTGPHLSGCPYPLEMIIKMYNINEGRNAEILERSETLKDYSRFVGRVREFEAALPRDEAMKAAIKRCMELGILKGFLETHSSEVFNMLITEWNDDEARLAWYDEGVEDGIAKGIEKGIERTALAALAKGIAPEIVREITGLDPAAIGSRRQDDYLSYFHEVKPQSTAARP